MIPFLTSLLAQNTDIPAQDNVKFYTYIFVGLSFSLYLGIAWVSRVKTTKGFYIAGQGIPALANGMATGADWMSAASFIGMAGLISSMGYAGGVYLMGWTGGYVLLALLLAPYLRKFGHFTVPDFIGDRYDSNTARFIAIICAIFISFTYVAGQMRGVGVVFSRFLDVDINYGVIIGMCIVCVYATLGGMKGITWTQVAQYWVLITAFLIPAIAISINLTGHAAPQIALGSPLLSTIDDNRSYMLEALNRIQETFNFGSYTDTFTGQWSKANVFFVTVALMAGTAGLPHVIVRFYTVRTVKAARWSAFWAILFISILYLSAPAVGAFAKYYMVSPVHGLNGKTHQQIYQTKNYQWFTKWENTGLIQWFDDGDNKLAYYGSGPDPKKAAKNEIFNFGKLDEVKRKQLRTEHTKWLESNHKQGTDARIFLRQNKLSGPDKDIIVLATPEMANLADWIIALMAAGGLAAALSTASGLLLVISSSVAHDLYYRMINPQASEKKRLAIGRITIVFAVCIAGYFGIKPPGFVAQVVAFAFGLAASSFFPAIVLGIFSKRVSTVPVLVGMITGLLFTSFYIIGCQFLEMEKWDFGIFDKPINPQGIGTIGMMLNFAITLALTPFFPKPSPKVIDMIDAVREPEGANDFLAVDDAH